MVLKNFRVTFVLIEPRPFSSAVGFSVLVFYEAPEGVKWELGFAHFLAGKMGFHALGLGFMGFSKNLGWEMGIGSPLQDPLLLQLAAMAHTNQLYQLWPESTISLHIEIESE